MAEPLTLLIIRLSIKSTRLLLDNIPCICLLRSSSGVIRLDIKIIVYRNYFFILKQNLTSLAAVMSAFSRCKFKTPMSSLMFID
jgi:hypothetical protein